MKKLKLDLKNVGEILTREQLKQVVGGYGSDNGACTAAVNCGTVEEPRNISCSCTDNGSCTSTETSVSCTCDDGTTDSDEC